MSCVSQVRTALAAIRQLKDLNMFISVRETEALSEAQLSDSRRQRRQPVGPLDGLMCAVKDNFCLQGSATTCGSNMLRNFVPTYNATVVQRIIDAGAIVLGKTNMDEFAMGSGSIDSVFGPVKNLWRSGLPYSLPFLPSLNPGNFTPDLSAIDKDDWVVAGGSSGGSAVATSCGLCFASLGSDTGGSVRIPAAWCGLVSLKPTYGSVSRHGLIPLVNSLDVPGLIARSVNDISLLFNALCGPDDKDSTTLDSHLQPGPVHVRADPDVSALRIGIPAEYRCQGMSDEVVQAWSDVIDLLDGHGVSTVSLNMPHTPYSITCYQVLNPCEVASNMARYDGIEFGLRTDEGASTEALFADVRHHGFNEAVRGRILAGNYFLLKSNYDNYFMQALKVRRLICQEFDDAWTKVDLLLTPATLTDAPSFSQFASFDNRTQTARHDYCTQPVNLAGLPAATLPVKLSSRSLPLSVQVIGPRCREQLVLSLCKWLENRLQFPQPNIDLAAIAG